MRKLSSLLTVVRTVRRRAQPPSGILEEGAVFSDVHSVILNPTTKLPYPEKEVIEHMEKTSQEVLRDKRAKLSTRKASSSKLVFDHIPIEEQIILLFPGQGAQFVGMGKNVLDCPSSRAIFQQANDILGYDLLKICVDGPSSKLDQTLYCQPAVFVSSMAALEKLKEQEPEAVDNFTDVAGFSVGEFCALVAAGVLSFEDALRIVKVRCEAMHECNQLVASGMMTIKVQASSRLEEAMQAAREMSKYGVSAFREACEMDICEIANYLYCGVRVIGASQLCMNFLEKHQDEYNFKVIKRLAVSGAFHTRQMNPAVEKVQQALKTVTLHNARCNVYSNYTGKIFPYKKSEIRQAIFKQVNHPVKWEQIQQLLYRKHQNLKFPRFIEVGPGRQLGVMLLQTSKKAFANYKNFSC